MCAGCWLEYGCPLPTTSKVRRLAADLKILIDEGQDFGNLYSVMQNFNVDDAHIAYHVGDRDAGRSNGDEPWTLEERAALVMLQICTEEERAAALAAASGYDEKLRDELMAAEPR